MSSDFNEPSRAYAQAPAVDTMDRERARFAPADNLYDAIRADVAPIGGVDFLPLFREGSREPPFNDIDWNPDDE